MPAGNMVPIMFSTYQKPHDKYLYIPFQSHHRSHVFRAFVRGELIRYVSVVVTNTLSADFSETGGDVKTTPAGKGLSQQLLAAHR